MTSTRPCPGAPGHRCLRRRTPSRDRASEPHRRMSGRTHRLRVLRPGVIVQQARRHTDRPEAGTPGLDGLRRSHSADKATHRPLRRRPVHDLLTPLHDTELEALASPEAAAWPIAGAVTVRLQRQPKTLLRALAALGPAADLALPPDPSPPSMTVVNGDPPPPGTLPELVAGRGRTVALHGAPRTRA